MNDQTKRIVEILKQPGNYPIERVSLALMEILEITREMYQTAAWPADAYAMGGIKNG
ncbi:MAG TPA: hypothetical protein PLM53_09560 [Spirochaetota bacterium]|nr:hypothetical protein [Spirochaetota bacterium]HPC40951.1 hypothetical protein [Spirochaetota bacterium]HPL18423.1 hypothetical protein [Spirochaetota bacterium]HQF08619.1 hypothetical protein [Spirochaetota bacterium]HQH97334.1 hypothetical protein [Spirochaetota bacterium]